MACSPDANFLATAIAVMILLLLPMALPIIRSIPGFNVSKVCSIGGGMATAAVFVFMVPDVMDKVEAVSAETSIAFLKQDHHLIFVLFATFLFAFCTMYALEKIALDRTKNNQEPNRFVFYLHMGVLCAMLIALVSSFPVLSKASFYAIGIVCSLAVFEIFLEEVALLKHFGDLYSHVGRYVVMLSIVIGWGLGLKFINQETTVFTLMTQAFVTGMILTAVIKAEFDLINVSNNYITFIVSAFTKTLIVLGLITIEDANIAKKEAQKATLPTANHTEEVHQTLPADHVNVNQLGAQTLEAQPEPEQHQPDQQQVGAEPLNPELHPDNNLAAPPPQQ